MDPRDVVRAVARVVDRDPLGTLARLLDQPRPRLAIGALIVAAVLVVAVPIVWVVSLIGLLVSALWVLWEFARRMAGGKDGT